MPYIGKSPSSGIRNRFIYTATAGQTTFSGTDDHNRTLSYTDAEFTDVFLNGVKLDKSDYTATSGTSIVLDSGATVGDTLEVLGFDTFSVFSGDFSQDVTIGGSATVSGDLTVDTSTLKVDSTNNRVGVGTASPAFALDVQSTSDPAQIRLKEDGNTNGLKIVNFDGDEAQINNVDNGPLVIKTNDTERMRVDSSGRLLVGKTTNAIGTAGHTLQGDGFASHTRDGAYPLGVNRLSDDGDLMKFFKDGTEVAAITLSSSDNISFGATAASGAGLFYFSASGGIPIILPAKANSVTDNEVDLGRSAQRFQDIFATNGTIVTSDQNEKQDIASLTSAEITAAKAISKLFKTFKWKDRVASKGDSARTHAGVIAQEVQSAMSDAGLDVTKYAFWCSDTFWEKDVEVPAVEADEKNGIKARDAFTRTDVYETEDEAPEGSTKVTRLSVRYPQLLAFVGAATEQRLADIETRLAALEAE